MNSLQQGRFERFKSLASRAMANRYLWGAIGWALLVWRYASEVTHPRYGG